MKYQVIKRGSRYLIIDKDTKKKVDSFPNQYYARLKMIDLTGRPCQ